MNSQPEHVELNDCIDINPDIFYVCYREGKLVKWNRALENLTGLGPEDIMYRPAIDFVAKEDRTEGQNALKKYLQPVSGL